ncbi:hypothetical protein H2248_008095 [Termitomyces sp. 'cryptogamus']|nr:hypothetical protein H2248_008095 [Termitomyces sp. 'cryptogamus']
MRPRQLQMGGVDYLEHFQNTINLIIRCVIRRGGVCNHLCSCVVVSKLKEDMKGRKEKEGKRREGKAKEGDLRGKVIEPVYNIEQLVSWISPTKDMFHNLLHQ